MGSFTKGDIVLFPFPYTDLSQRKLRPCLIISNEMKEDIILCQITSKNIKKDNYSIEVKSKDTLSGSLKIDSYVRCNMIFTAESSQIINKICKISTKQYKEVINKIIKILNM